MGGDDLRGRSLLCSVQSRQAKSVRLVVSLGALLLVTYAAGAATGQMWPGVREPGLPWVASCAGVPT